MVSLKGRVWRFLSIALVKVVMDYSSVPVCQGGAPMYGRGQFLTVTVNPLLLSRALARTRLHSVVVDRHNRRGASVDGAGIRQSSPSQSPERHCQVLSTTEVCGLLIDHVAILCNVIKQRQSGWCPWAMGWPKWAQPIFDSALSHSSNTILYTVLSERL